MDSFHKYNPIPQCRKCFHLKTILVTEKYFLKSLNKMNSNTKKKGVFILVSSLSEILTSLQWKPCHNSKTIRDVLQNIFQFPEMSKPKHA